MSDLRGIPARPRSYATIEPLAAAWRKALAPDAGPIDAVRGVATFDRIDSMRVRARGRSFGLTYEVSNFHPVACAYFSAVDDVFVVSLSERTYRDLEEDVPRARFSLGHELGHVALHAEELMQIAERPSLLGRATRHEVWCDTEWQADGFAGAFLMPAHGIAVLRSRGTVDPFVLQEHFIVSSQAASKRLAVYGEKKLQLVRRI